MRMISEGMAAVLKAYRDDTTHGSRARSMGACMRRGLIEWVPNPEATGWHDRGTLVITEAGRKELARFERTHSGLAESGRVLG